METIQGFLKSNGSLQKSHTRIGAYHRQGVLLINRPITCLIHGFDQLGPAHTDRAKLGPWHPTDLHAMPGAFHLRGTSNRESRTILGYRVGRRARYQKVTGTCALTGRSADERKNDSKRSTGDSHDLSIARLSRGYARRSLCFYVHLVRPRREIAKARDSAPKLNSSGQPAHLGCSLRC